MATVNLSGVQCTIIDQLGGNRFVAMTGATFSVAGNLPNRLEIRIPRIMNRMHSYIQIDYREAADLYEVAFINANWRVVSKHEGIYVDMLLDLIEAETGLACSLRAG